MTATGPDDIIEEKALPPKVNPFLTSSTECPICKSEVPWHHIKPSIYSERDKDVDLRPRTVKWLKEGYSEHHPRLYYMLHCSHCHFTADSETFEAPSNQCSLSAAKFSKRFTALYTQNRQVKKIVNKLSSGINVLSLDLYQAVKLHLLAIFQFQLFDEIAKKDAMNIGRYCLRLAWLYRDIYELDTKKKEQAGRIIKLIRSLKKDWPLIPANEKTALKMAAQYYQTTLEGSYAVETVYDEINLLMILSRIHMKLGDIPEAHTFLGSGKAKFRNFERETSELMRLSAQADKAAQSRRQDDSPMPKKKVSDEQLLEMSTDSRKLKFLTDEVQMLFEDVRDEWERKQKEKANKIIEAHQDKPVEELRRILLHNKIDKGVVLKLYPEQTKKKGLFNIFD